MNKTTSFIIESSVIIVLLAIMLIVPSVYLHKSTDRLNNTIDRLIDEIYKEDWVQAQQSVSTLEKDWQKEKKLRALTLEEEYIMELDNSLIQCKASVETQNRSLAYEYANIIKHILEEALFSASFRIENFL